MHTAVQVCDQPVSLYPFHHPAAVRPLERIRIESKCGDEDGAAIEEVFLGRGAVPGDDGPAMQPVDACGPADAGCPVDVIDRMFVLRRDVILLQGSHSSKASMELCA